MPEPPAEQALCTVVSPEVLPTGQGQPWATVRAAAEKSRGRRVQRPHMRSQILLTHTQQHCLRHTAQLTTLTGVLAAVDHLTAPLLAAAQVAQHLLVLRHPAPPPALPQHPWCGLQPRGAHQEQGQQVQHTAAAVTPAAPDPVAALAHRRAQAQLAGTACAAHAAAAQCQHQQTLLGESCCPHAVAAAAAAASAASVSAASVYAASAVRCPLLQQQQQPQAVSPPSAPVHLQSQQLQDARGACIAAAAVLAPRGSNSNLHTTHQQMKSEIQHSVAKRRIAAAAAAAA